MEGRASAAIQCGSVGAALEPGPIPISSALDTDDVARGRGDCSS
eukprot:SAG11_NODE_3222_length_2601_cov_9.871703_2_plen_44_part_00